MANHTTAIDYGFTATREQILSRLSACFGTEPIPAASPLWHAPIPPRSRVGALMRELHAAGRLAGFKVR